MISQGRGWAIVNTADRQFEAKVVVVVVVVVMVWEEGLAVIRWTKGATMCEWLLKMGFTCARRSDWLSRMP
jgi:hypothetical protein